MGRGRIVSGGTNGSYTVELLHNRERIDAEIAALNTRITELEESLVPLETEREALVVERNAIASEIDAAVAAAAEGEVPDVEALLAELAQVSAQIQSLDVRIAMLQVRILQATQRRRMLQAIPANPQQQAWCADLTADLAGEVATVEVPAEGVVGQFATWRRMQIRPGYGGRANYLPARDGQMFHRAGQSPEQVFLNAAILPGAQKWRPQYRIGTLTAVNKEANTCSLSLQSEDSSAQNLLIDPPDLQYTKTGVPIEYMDCDAQAFEVGDRVLVEFQGRDWSSPKVIGFEKEPRPCNCPYPFGAVDGPEEDMAVNKDGVRCYVLKTSEEIRLCSAYLFTESGQSQQVAVYKAVSSPASEADLSLPAHTYMDFVIGELIWSGITAHVGSGLTVWNISPQITIAENEYIFIAAWAQTGRFMHDPFGQLALGTHPGAVPDWASEMHPMPGSTGTEVDAGLFNFSPQPDGCESVFCRPGAAGMIGERPRNGSWGFDIDNNVIPLEGVYWYYRFGINRTREDLEAE